MPEAGVADQGVAQLVDILRTPRRIPNSSKWFEIIALPNDAYALWEPGHAEKVNSLLITGARTDMLYDPGMGIASIVRAVLLTFSTPFDGLNRRIEILSRLVRTHVTSSEN